MAFQKEEQQVISRVKKSDSNKDSPKPLGKDQKKTVIIGATDNPNRYAYMAAERLKNHNHPIVPLGIKRGQVMGQDILDIRNKPEIEDVDTVTMYINPSRQAEWEDYILGLNPKRIIFNPGTENPEFASKAESSGIKTLDACTLVMLSVGNY